MKTPEQCSITWVKKGNFKSDDLRKRKRGKEKGEDLRNLHERERRERMMGGPTSRRGKNNWEKGNRKRRGE